MKLKVKKLNSRAIIPQYQTDGSSGFDLHAWFEIDDTIKTVYPKQSALINTKLSFAVGQGYEMQVRPRSGLAIKNGITIINSPGTVDSDYRGEVKIILYNLGSNPFEIRHGDRIAQAVICPVHKAEIQEVRDLDETERGSGGFGSTGTSKEDGGNNAG